jgi:hypothetical protein
LGCDENPRAEMKFQTATCIALRSFHARPHVVRGVMGIAKLILYDPLQVAFDRRPSWRFHDVFGCCIRPPGARGVPAAARVGSVELKA